MTDRLAPPGMRIVSVTPAGRQRYLEVLVPYLLRHRHLIDEHHWWLNTRHEPDRHCVLALCRQYPDFFRVCDRPVSAPRGRTGSIWGFWRDYVDPHTLYLRFDDDICYMADGAVEALIRHRLARPRPLLVLGNIVNNAVCGHFHQRAGLIPTAWGAITQDCLDRRGWEDPAFARRLHRLFLADIVAGRVDRWKRTPMAFDGLRWFSINVISWFGRDLAGLPELDVDATPEEPFITETLPRRWNRPNEICPEALFAHFAFYSQRPLLERLAPELLEAYRRIATGEPYAGPTAGERVRACARGVAWCALNSWTSLRAVVARRAPARGYGPLAREVIAVKEAAMSGRPARTPSLPG